MNRKEFNIFYNDGVFAENIVFNEGKTDKEIQEFFNNEIQEFNKNPNKDYHITMNNIVRVK